MERGNDYVGYWYRAIFDTLNMVTKAEVNAWRDEWSREADEYTIKITKEEAQFRRVITIALFILSIIWVYFSIK